MSSSQSPVKAFTTQESNSMQAELEKDRLKLLLDMTNTLVSNLELRDLLRAISASIRQDMHCDSVGVWLPDPDRCQLRQLAQDFPESKGFVTEDLLHPIEGSEVGTVFNTVVLVTGPIWARPVWGIWWTWDARLTSTFVLWLLYIAYLLLRTLVEDPERRATVSAVFGIFAFLDVPLVYMSIRWWRTQHPQPVLFGGPGSGLDPKMRVVFYTCWVALVALMALVMRQRFRVEALWHEVEELRMQAEGR